VKCLVESFTPKEREILSKFCTNIDSDVFALINLPEVVKGALFSRYSRSSKSLKRLLLDEFISNSDLGLEEFLKMPDNSIVATSKAEEFYQRVLIGYGDDSVAELGGAHLAFENISNIATKVIQDSRIGLSPLEKSTRYVYFNEKVNGQYKYLREEKIMQSQFADDYIQACDLLFDTYSKLIPVLSKIEEEKFPNDGSLSERAYASTIRAKVCDILRVLLPASTLTNCGVFGNGRAFEYLLVKMYSSPLSEVRLLAQKAHEELSKVIPSFVKRANDKYGKELQNYFSSTSEKIFEISKELSKEISEVSAQLNLENKSSSFVRLVDYDKNAEEKILAAILFPFLHSDLSSIREYVKNLDQKKREEIILAYIGNRSNRRQKPGRAFEFADYTFCINANFGIYRDLHRHRILSQMRQLLTTNGGFEMPKEIVDAGLQNEVLEAIDFAKEVYNKISKEMPYEAQYVVSMGYNVSWIVKMNLREAYHFCELRSMRQGHRDYRKVAQEIHRLISSVHPLLASGMKFVDYNDYEFERLEAEKKLDEKINALKKLKEEKNKKN